MFEDGAMEHGPRPAAADSPLIYSVLLLYALLNFLSIQISLR